MRVLLRLIGVLGLALLALPAPASAQARCDCVPVDLDRELKGAEVVFVGTVTGDGVASSKGVTYDVTATTLYKGQLPDVQLQVVATGGCGEPLEDGKIRLFVVSGEPPYRIGCSGAFRISPASLKAIAAQDLTGRDVVAPEEPPDVDPPSEALLRKLAAPDAPALPEMLAIPAGLTVGGLLAISVAGLVGRRRR